MNILIILGHPDKNSFNHGIAWVCKSQLVNNGYDIFFHDLYEEQFNPVLYLNPENESVSDSKNIEQHIFDLKNCNGIIIIHPNWWGQPPAIIKGWLDRVLLRNVAYKFEETQDGGQIPVGLLKAKTALVINTSNTDEEMEKSIYNDPLETLWKKRVFQFCGITSFERKNFSVVKDSTEAIRDKWLAETRQLIDTYFPKITAE